MELLFDSSWIILLLSGVVLAAPTDDAGLINETGMDSIGEITMDDETFLMHIVPSGMTSKKLYKSHQNKLSDFFDSDNEFLNKFMDHMEKGHTLKSLTFNIYDDNIREATIALFRLICYTDIIVNYKKIKEWAILNINDHMLDYAERLCALHSKHTSYFNHKVHEPPFLFNSNFYVNGETVIKYLKIRSTIEKHNHGNYNDLVNQVYRRDYLNTIVINTNYSGWNLPQDGCGEKLDFFTEDIGLNAFYYGMHLLHPYWITNNELDDINPRQAEHYFFNHKQLWARYQLEKESAKQRNASRNVNCDNPFNPYLIYNNGVPFPMRSNIQGDFNEDRVKLRTIDITIEELLSRGFLIMDSGSKRVKLTDDNYIGLISKMIRANYDSINTAKIARNLYGYGRNGYTKDIYNPAPSLLHQPETTLRDPAFWDLLEFMLKYYKAFAQTLSPMNMASYETEDFEIFETNISKITTYFDYYQFEMFKNENVDNGNNIPIVTARQRRLSQLPWFINFSIKSNVEQDIIIRVFLGPPCSTENCWKNHDMFFLLDVRPVKITTGYNNIIWRPEESQLLSSDTSFNKEEPNHDKNKYNMFKFPQNLLLPKGSEEGVNMTLFIIATAADSFEATVTEDSFYYNIVSVEYDTKPIGFPFHRPAENFEDQANNYRFFNVTIYHKKRPLADDGSGFFSPHLY